MAFGKHDLGKLTSTFVQNILITLQIADDFRKVIMHSDVISCVICVSNKVEYLKKEKSKTRKLINKELHNNRTYIHVFEKTDNRNTLPQTHFT